jgi:hypothetical protein
MCKKRKEYEKLQKRINDDNEGKSEIREKINKGEEKEEEFKRQMLLLRKKGMVLVG